MAIKEDSFRGINIEKEKMTISEQRWNEWNYK